jgi:hypothetical protein
VDIASIAFVYELRDDIDNYTYQQCKDRGVKYFNVRDRPLVIQYLTGEKDSCPVTVDGRVAKISKKRKQDGYFPAEPLHVEAEAKDGEEDDDDPLSYLRKHERNFGGRNARQSFLGNDGAHRPEVALKFVAEEQASRQKGEESRDKRSKTSRVPRAPVMRPSLLEELSQKTSRSGESVRPYIILPRSSGCLLNLLNGEKFLKDAQYAPPQGDVFKANPFEVSAKINGRDMIFRVTDDITHFGKLEWLQTVAVFIDGSKWQFNKWPFKDLADLYATIKGFYLSYEHQTPKYTNTLAGEMWSAAQKEMVGNVIVDQYPVVKYMVKRSTISRHVDGLVAYQFWREMEAFLMQPRIAKFTNQSCLSGS